MTIKLRKEVIARSVIAGGKATVRRKAEKLGVDMVTFGTEIISAEFVTDRPPNRRRTSDIHLVNALRSEVVDDGNNVTVFLTTKRGVSDVKVRTMNNGSVAHRIRPRGQFLKFPGFVEGFTGRRSAVFNAYSGDQSARAKVVDHPGRSRTARGTRFMQRAVARAVANIR